jgi:hypothetical protein
VVAAEVGRVLAAAVGEIGMAGINLMKPRLRVELVIDRGRL